MTCLNCSTENTDGRKFCRECGRLMVHYCQKCGFANSLHDNYCGGCGVNLSDKQVTAGDDHMKSPAVPGNYGSYSDDDIKELISEQSQSKKKQKKKKEKPAVSQDVLDNIFDSDATGSGEKEG